MCETGPSYNFPFTYIRGERDRKGTGSNNAVHVWLNALSQSGDLTSLFFVFLDDQGLEDNRKELTFHVTLL